MAYIYMIKNDINNKIYIGKTFNDVNKRWKEHCRDYKKRINEQRPLYNAMNKYGLEHFHIEIIEECDLKDLEEREIYWIQFYQSFKNGYNATLGGDGKPYLDYDLIFKTYLQTKNMKQTAYICNCCEDSVSFIVHLYLTNEEIKNFTDNLYATPVAMLDKQNQILKTFSSASAAARYLNKSRSANGHILDVCKGKRKSAYGYKWMYL